MIMTDEESVVLIMEITNSYILLDKENKKEEPVEKDDNNSNEQHTIALSTKIYEPLKEYLSDCFAEIKKTNDISSLIMLYECRFKHHKTSNTIVVVHCVRGDYYVDVTVSGKSEDKIIKQMELIHTTLEDSKASEKYTLITSYDSVSKYYCNKMYPLLNEVERKLRKLLYIMYTLRYRKDYIDYTFIDNILSPVSKKAIIDKLKSQKDSGDKRKLEQRFFEEFEYNHYKHLLFFPKWTAIDIANKENFLKVNLDLAKLSDEELRERFSVFTPMSDWEKHFSSKVDKDISGEMLISNVQKPRNKVAHYKTITKDEYNDFLENVHKLIEVIDNTIEVTTSKDFIEETMKHYTQSISELLEPLQKSIRICMDNLFDSMFHSAQSIVDTLDERFDDTEQGLDDSESEDEDNA